MGRERINPWATILPPGSVLQIGEPLTTFVSDIRKNFEKIKSKMNFLQQNLEGGWIELPEG